MFLRLNQLSLEPSQWGGRDLIIKKVTLLDDTGNYIKHIKIDEKVLELLNKVKIKIEKYVEG